MTLQMPIMGHLKQSLVIKLSQILQKRKRLKLSNDKCKLLRINGGKSDVNSLTVYGEPMKVEETFKYLGDTFNSKGNNVALCKHRVDKSVGYIIEIISLCKETNFGKHQIFSMMAMYQSVFLPRLIYNCESWSNLTQRYFKPPRRSVEFPETSNGGSKIYTHCCIISETWWEELGKQCPWAAW